MGNLHGIYASRPKSLPNYPEFYQSIKDAHEDYARKIPSNGFFSVLPKELVIMIASYVVGNNTLKLC